MHILQSPDCGVGMRVEGLENTARVLVLKSEGL